MQVQGVKLNQRAEPTSIACLHICLDSREADSVTSAVVRLLLPTIANIVQGSFPQLYRRLRDSAVIGQSCSTIKLRPTAGMNTPILALF